MSDRSDSSVWAHPESLARLDEFFRDGVGNARSSFSQAFMGKYGHWFGPSAPALSRRLRARWRWLDAILGLRIIRGERVLDAGAGFGVNALLMALAGAREVVAVDLREDRVDDLRRLATIAGLSAIRSVCAPYQSQMGECASFNLLICSYFLSHLDHDEEFLELCRKTIALGGKLYLADDNNALSPLRQATVRGEWWRAELMGNRDNARGFLAMRRGAIESALAALPGQRSWAWREYCAWATRGMTLEQSAAYCRWLRARDTDKPPRPIFSYRDPVNGIVEERLLNPLRLAGQLRSKGFEVAVFPGTRAGLLGRLHRLLASEFELVATRM